MPRRKEPRIPDAVLDQLLAGADPRTALEPNGLLDGLKKALAERVLSAGCRAGSLRPCHRCGRTADRAALHRGRAAPASGRAGLLLPQSSGPASPARRSVRRRRSGPGSTLADRRARAVRQYDRGPDRDGGPVGDRSATRAAPAAPRSDRRLSRTRAAAAARLTPHRGAARQPARAPVRRWSGRARRSSAAPAQSVPAHARPRPCQRGRRARR
jgi:hypothetical protein